MNKQLLKAECSAHGESLKALAKHIGICECSMSQKCNGKSDFTLSEVKSIADRYGLDTEKIYAIFIA